MLGELPIRSVRSDNSRRQEKQAEETQEYFDEALDNSLSLIFCTTLEWAVAGSGAGRPISGSGSDQMIRLRPAPHH